jgi:hypothetical protein
MITRLLEKIIKDKIDFKKAIIVLGSRQTGKTTLLSHITEEMKNVLFLNCDNPIVRQQLENANYETLLQLIGSNKVLFIDEAQRVKNIGLTLKIIIDQTKDVQLFISGSSAFELANEMNEPLTGRKWEYILYPISWQEFESNVGYLTAIQQFENRLIYGMYPEIINKKGDEIEVLQQLTTSLLYKDILSHSGIRKPDVLEKLLRALALQIGSEVNFNELSSLLRVDKNTVNTYINLLEKTFIIFRLNPLSRNLRNEINTSRKIYFYDNGIRNSLISNFSPLEFREDKGALFENFLISERVKALHYNKVYSNIYFWRTTQQQEIDYVEDRNGELFAFEFKFSAGKNPKLPITFSKNYPETEFKVINKENFQEFLNIKNII